MRLRALLILVVLSMSACGYLPSGSTSGHTLIDYVNFVQWGGRTYLQPWQSGRRLTESDLGVVQFKVQHEISESGQGPGYQPADGDAAYLRPGTEVFAVRGYSPTFRLAAYQQPGQLVLFEVSDNPRAKAGRDVLDIGGKVQAIVVLSKADERTVLGRIDDPTRVARLAAAVLDAPVDASRRQNGGELSAFVSFQLLDGTATTQPYRSGALMLGRGILVPSEFTTAIDQVIATAPTPTPMPTHINLAQRYNLAGAVRVYVKRIYPGAIQNAAQVQQFVAVLNLDLQTLNPVPAVPTDYTVVGFEFADHYVAFAYDPSTNTLSLATPQDNLAVHPPQRFHDLVSQPVAS